ncbi:hypothetical protein C8R44DRAFT_744836 [Mycena epipterygia]|nr:hypothetical protein C8R44DRAFT_744836 [Mycena epipterygia]
MADPSPKLILTHSDSNTTALNSTSPRLPRFGREDDGPRSGLGFDILEEKFSNIGRVNVRNNSIVVEQVKECEFGISGLSVQDLTRDLTVTVFCNVGKPVKFVGGEVRDFWKLGISELTGFKCF